MEDNTLKRRVRRRNAADVQADATCVVYIMSRDQRTRFNPALIAAQKTALKQELPLFVVFNIYTAVGFRSKQHYEWMFTGLTELAASLREKHIPMLFVAGQSATELEANIAQLKPSSVYFDFNPLRGPQKFIADFAAQSHAACFEVDAHNVIPAWVASDKEEFAAHTFRKKVTKHLADFLHEDEPTLQAHPYLYEPAVDWTAELPQLATDILAELHQTNQALRFISGEAAAQAQLSRFLDEKLPLYAVERNKPDQDGLSGLSPYLHFGQVSALEVAQQLSERVRQGGADDLLLVHEATMAKLADASNPTVVESANALAEELIVRKELADNFCLYASSYKTLAGAHDWAQQTIREHAADEREYNYSLRDFETAQTHDPAWNAAQLQMVQTGKMHGYMRMYWAKKILEWTPDAQTALDIAIELNDRYSLDGGDPNGYTGIMWSIAGVHDRAWTERAVFGKIRYMNAAGLKRKFNIAAYIEEWTGTQKLL